MRTPSILLVGGLLAIGGCQTAQAPPAVAPALQALVAGEPLVPVAPHVWADVVAFYGQRAGTPAWIDESRENPTSRVANAIELLHTAHAHGLDGDYGATRIAELPARIKALHQQSPERVQQLAELDVRITTALLALGRDVALGRTRPEAIDPRWKSQRTAPAFVTALNQAAAGDLPAWLDSIRPPHPEYAALQKALADLEDPRTAARRPASNAPIEERIAQLRLNLERWRWAPDDFGARYFIVNIPQFLLTAVENGRPVMDIRVVVGKTGHETPVFSGAMENVVFNPYWNIPESIAEGETAPAIRRDRNYLAKNNIEVLRVSSNNVEVIDASEVSWDDPKALKGLTFRQRPGASNALGKVKFLFPNPFDVYLHGSPEPWLFSKPSRAFSHGCVRVEEPEKLASYVLRDDKAWDVKRMNAAIHSGVEKYVRLQAKIPVHVVYFTAWVDEAGGLHSQPDIYGYDKKQGGGLQ